MSLKKLLLSVFVFGSAVLFSGSCGGGGNTPAVDTSPSGDSSVILICVDGLRVDALKAFGAETSMAPAIDALASSSLRFQQAWSQSPSMGASLAAILSGLYPTTNGLVEPGQDLAAEATTVAELASSAGFVSAAFLHGEEETTDHGLAQGFGKFIRQQNDVQGAVDLFLAEHSHEKILLLGGGWSIEDALMTGDLDEALLSKLSARRLAPTEHLGESFDEAELKALHQAYAKAVGQVDADVAALLKVLKDRGVMDSATVVLFGTNGIALGEGGELFAETLAPAVTHIPLIIHRPGETSPVDIRKVVELVDLAPTLEGMMSLEIPGETQGSDLSKIIEGAGQPPYVAFSESDFHGGMNAVVMDGMQLRKAGGHSLLCELSSDPLCMQDVSEKYPERVKVLEEHLGAWSKMVAAASLDPDRKTEKLDEDTLEQLKSLGYIQ